ncbi:MAG: DUF6045 family protein [Ruminococcus sp.]|nr:DUF6045 family protein [Ruminococcus sp.]
MFDWIGDAIDWIGDGISSLWDSTVGNATQAIGDWIWETMFEWLFDLIYGGIADLFQFINNSTSDIFALTWVQAFIGLFHNLAWMLFVCGLIVAVFDTAIAYEFPESTHSFAYRDYCNSTTQKNASALISEIIENNADRISNRENYIGYLANRPGAVKFDTHALFSQEDTPIDLNAVAKEIANHGGNTYQQALLIL